VDAGGSVSRLPHVPQFPDGGVAEERGAASCGDQVRGGTAPAGMTVPSRLRRERSCRTMLALTSVAGTPTTTRRTTTEPSCRRW